MGVAWRHATISGVDELLHTAAAMAVVTRVGVDERRVFPDATALAGLAAFDEPLPATGAPAAQTLRTARRGRRPGHDGVDRRPTTSGS